MYGSVIPSIATYLPVDLGALAMRATFGLPVGPDGEHRASIADLTAITGQLRDVFRVAGAIDREQSVISATEEMREWMDTREAPFGLTRSPLFSPLDVPVPRVERVRLESPLEIVLTLPEALGAGSAGLVTLVVLAERVFTLPLRISVQRERLKAELEEYREACSWDEDRAFSEVALALRYPSDFEARDIEIYDWAEGPDVLDE